VSKQTISFAGFVDLFFVQADVLKRRSKVLFRNFARVIAALFLYFAALLRTVALTQFGDQTNSPAAI
jgi:hypothetical protein